jgi:AraC-like DNA-binding protein/quercetin dioxygenase-like cupin family protein
MKPFLEHIQSHNVHPSLQIFNVDLGKQSSNWHYHPELELTYVISGTGLRLVGDHLGSFGPGDLVLTGENLPHDFMVVNDGDRAQFIVIQFSFALIERLPEFGDITLLLQRARTGCLFHSPPSSIVELLQGINKQEPAQKLISLFMLLHSLSKHEQSEQLCDEHYVVNTIGDVQRNRLNLVMDFIQDNYTRSIALSEIADVTAMTEPSFCRWFKRSMDCSFVNFLNKCRVEYASRLLLNSGSHIVVIGQQCGFDTISSFNRAFKKQYAVSPTQFRKRMKVV